MLHRKTTTDTEFKLKLYLFVLVATIIGIIVVPGCKTTNSSSGYSSQPASQIENASSEIDRSVENIIQTTTSIEDKTKDIKKDASEIESQSQIPEVRENARVIDQKTEQILQDLRSVQDQANDIKKQNSVIDNTSGRIQELENSVQEYKNEGTAEAKKKLYNLILGMSAFGGVSILGGIILFFFNPKMGAMIAAFGLITSVIAVAGVYYLKWIAVIGFVLLGISLLVTLIFMVRAFIEAKTFKQSHEENVELIEEIKQELPEDTKQDIFGEGGKAEEKQSEKVKKAIQKTRQKLNSE